MLYSPLAGRGGGGSVMEVSARAPGKIILSGEHAVVHGSAAVASSIDIHTRFLIRSHGDEDGQVELELGSMGLSFSWASNHLRGALGEGAGSPSSPAPCSLEQLQAITALVAECLVPEAMAGLAFGVSAFLHLYTSIHGFGAGKAVVTSDLPLGSGLGSSAAFCVSLSAALLASSGVICPPEREGCGWIVPKASDLELINKWAFEGEKLIHGKPSGIDNAVSTFGGMIMFKSGVLAHLKSSAPLGMLITNTKVVRNTKALVAGVSERASRHPDAMAAVFTAIDSISKELATIIESSSLDGISITSKERKLEELMEMNQGLLQCMGVSHSSIEAVLGTTLKYKLASKLTGAGGGGCVLTLLPALLSGSVVGMVITELESCGFQCFKAEVGGKGVEVCFG